MGADIHGKIYGLYAEGGEVAIYANGTSVQNGPQLHLQPNGTDQQTVLYAHVSTDMTVQTSGYATLSSGKATIQFDKSFAEAVSPDFPVVVTISPLGISEGIYLTEVDEKGFGVAESGDAKSNGKFAFIAVGRRAGFENPEFPAEATQSDFVERSAGGLHNDADTKSEGRPYYENGKLSVGKHPSTNVDRTGAASQTRLVTGSGQ
ncbi:MAG: hypothetical protein IPH20_23330 [Bacteroidales bacterium]|nr:hypothetical protein [Bacteroidales bacterium]